MKLGEVLEHGKHGEFYELHDTVGGWSGAIVRVFRPQDQTTPALVVTDKGSKPERVGRMLPLCTAVTGADYRLYEPKEDSEDEPT